VAPNYLKLTDLISAESGITSGNFATGCSSLASWRHIGMFLLHRPCRALAEKSAHRRTNLAHMAKQLIVFIGPQLYGNGAMVEPTIADDDEPILSHATKLIIAVAVFALGVPIGAAIAAWVMPPS